MAITKTIEINAPVARVFDWVTDPEKHKQWLKGIESTTFAGDPHRVGTKFVQRIKEGARVNDYDGEVTAFEQDRRLGIILSGKAFTVAVDYQFEPITADQTRLTFSCDFQTPSAFVKFLMRVFGWFTRRMFAKQFDKLRELAEGRVA